MGSKRSIYLEEGPQCTIHNIGNEILAVEDIHFNGSNSSTWENESFPNFQNIENKSYYGFVFTDEYVVSCTNLEISLYLIIAGVVVFLIVVGVVIFAACTTIKYKNMYTKLLDEKVVSKEMKPQESIFFYNYFYRAFRKFGCTKITYLFIDLLEYIHFSYAL